MDIRKIKEQVLEANRSLPDSGLVTLTWGNVSGASREHDLMFIKPSGVDYRKLTLDDLVTIRISDGTRVGGELNPSSDSPTHLELYRAFPEIGGVTHTHSPYATIFAQAAREIPCLGTTHADHFHGSVPVARWPTEQEVAQGYEQATGKIIVESIAARPPLEIPAILLPGHGPFTWGTDATASLTQSIALEQVAFMAWQNHLATPSPPPLPAYLLDKHYLRKHGPGAYYGQRT